MEIHNCSKCDYPARLHRHEANESTYGGGASVSCNNRNCDNTEYVDAYKMKVSADSYSGNTGWDHVKAQIDAAENEVVRRWNLLNRKRPPLTREQKDYLIEQELLQHIKFQYSGPWDDFSYPRIETVSVCIPIKYIYAISPLGETYKVQTKEEAARVIWKYEKDELLQWPMFSHLKEYL